MYEDEGNMKILQINSHYNIGGAGKIVTYLHHELLRNGIDSVVLYGRGEEKKEINVYRIGSELSNKIDALTTRIVGSVGFQSYIATKQAIKIIEKENPTLLHLHVLHGYYLNYKILFDYINKKGIPCVWSFHDCMAFTGKCGYPYECKKYIDGCNHCQLLRDYPKTYGFDLTALMWQKKKDLFTGNSKKVIVSPSEWMTLMAKSSYFSKYDCVTIHNGIDTENTFVFRQLKKCRQDLGIPENAKVALGVAFGQENPRKGVKYIIQAAKDLPDVHFILIGWKNTKKNDISGLKNVTVREFISDQEELAKYYACADVFLLPSLAENYATTAIEAQASGTPVVGFKVGGIPEQANGILGDTVDVGNQKAFENKILKWCNSRQHNEIERKQRSDIVRTNNSMIRMFENYRVVYNRLLDDER